MIRCASAQPQVPGCGSLGDDAVDVDAVAA